jgi:eukaryotic-like serine/threonine-protein kinase
MSALGFDAADWPRISALLDQAMDLTPDARAAWLDTLSPADRRLRSVLADLLQGDAQAEPQLPALEAADAEPWHQGDVIGPYRLLRLLGQGGMGSVWLARRADGVLQRPVALKLPRTAAARPGLADRMARERDLLAALSHPHIAQLYDAGLTPQGQPWLALEVVTGERIDRHCQAEGLDIPARLGLFLQAAQAVAHAHAKLIVHRDLKPSNLLVDAKHQVKLLDFGIAKLMDSTGPSDSTLTREGSHPMTPDYASPEQVAGLPVDTRSDIYSLGVVLYELLTGQRPHRATRPTVGAVEEAILHGDVVRPSELARDRPGQATTVRALRGDLDTIALKALKKNPAERYATVQALAEDVERHLQRRPVLARPDSMGYVLRRLVSRHRLAFAGAAVALLAVLGGASLALWQAHRADVERRSALDVKAFVTQLLRDASPYHGADPSRVSLLDLLHQARKQLAVAHIDQPAVRAELQGVVGEALMSFGDIDAAEALIDSAARLARDELGESHIESMRARLLQLQIHRLKGRNQALARELDSLMPVLRSQSDRDVEPLILGLENVAMLAFDRGQAAQAEQAALEAVQLAETRLPENHPERIATNSLLAMAYRAGGQHAMSRDAAARALAALQAVYGDEPHPRRSEALALHGRALAELGELARGADEIGQAVSEAERLLGHDNVAVAMLRQNGVPYWLELGQLARADADSSEALRVVATAAPPTSYLHAATASSRGAVLVAQRRFADALTVLEPAAHALAAVLPPGHAAVVDAETWRVLALTGAGRVTDAAAALPQLQRWQRLPTLPPHLAIRLRRAQAAVQHGHGDSDAAVQTLRDATQQPADTPKAQRARMRAWADLGAVLAQQGDTDGARQAWQQALAAAATLESAPTPMQAEARAGLAALGR